jgi:hypothetical protein
MIQHLQDDNSDGLDLTKRNRGLSVIAPIPVSRGEFYEGKSMSAYG